MYKILETEEYKNWFDGLNFKEKAQVDARMGRLRMNGHFGIVKKLDKNLAEFKWKNGWRVYFSVLREGSRSTIFLLLGGNKNNQDRDINRAKTIRYNLEEKD